MAGQSHTRNEARRKQALHSEWHEKVYDRVQRKIDAELSRRSSKEVTERLNAQMDDYIKVSNTKRYGVYRDIIIPEEYDPLTPHEAIIHYANPTKYDARNYGAIRRNSAQFGAIL